MPKAILPMPSLTTGRVNPESLPFDNLEAMNRTLLKLVYF